MTEAADKSKAALPADETELLLHYLQTHEAVCPLCKYNLRNLTVPRCPECGRSIRLAVGLVEQVIWPYVMLLVGLVAPAGPGLLLIMVTIKEGRVFFDHVPALEFVTIVSFQVMVLPAVGAVVFRRRFLRLGVGTQRVLGFGAMATALTLYTCYVLIFFMRH